jgi:biotin-(acetyl-CoA carboxylase) ligase
LTGRSILITDSGRTIAGTCLGLDDDGALRVQTGQSVERLFSGVVTDFG